MKKIKEYIEQNSAFEIGNYQLNDFEKWMEIIFSEIHPPTKKNPRYFLMNGRNFKNDGKNIYIETYSRILGISFSFWHKCEINFETGDFSLL